jgi:hypothetical protein
MARGNVIIVTADPQGTFREGYIAAGQTPKPGTIMQRDPTVALQQGRATYKIYSRDADGDQPLGAFWVLLWETAGGTMLRGKAIGDAYAAGDRCALYSPKDGEELNLLVLNLAGTADDHAAGEIMMVDSGTGMLIATTGTPETEVATLLETITDPVADTLAWVEWTGH